MTGSLPIPPGEPYGRLYTAHEAMQTSPRFKESLQTIDCGTERYPARSVRLAPKDHEIWNSWIAHDSTLLSESVVLATNLATNSEERLCVAGKVSHLQRRMLPPEGMKQLEADDAAAKTKQTREATEKALAEPTVKYALMPKLEEIQDQFAGETHAIIFRRFRSCGGWVAG